MKKQITSISPFQTAKVIALLYFVISLPFIALLWLLLSFMPGSRPPMMGMALAMPFFYLIFGFIITVIGAWVYNLVARWVGGIEFTTTEVDKS